MSFIIVLISVGATLFLWMYLLTYFMHRGAQSDFFFRARGAVFRGMCIAAILLIGNRYFTALLTHFQWILLPILFFIGGLPAIWKRWKSLSLIPLGIAITVYGLFYWSLSQQILSGWFYIFQAPFYEEIGKWFQSLIYAYPGVMSPFVAIGFGFFENTAYFVSEFTWSQFLGRSLFSLPMHLFAGFLGFWCLFAFRPLWLGMAAGCAIAILFHTLYNWSLEYSLILTLIIMIGGYVFYGWSLENGWWKKGLKR